MYLIHLSPCDVQPSIDIPCITHTSVHSVTAVFYNDVDHAVLCSATGKDSNNYSTLKSSLALPMPCTSSSPAWLQCSAMAWVWLRASSYHNIQASTDESHATSPCTSYPQYSGVHVYGKLRHRLGWVSIYGYDSCVPQSTYKAIIPNKLAWVWEWGHHITAPINFGCGPASSSAVHSDVPWWVTWQLNILCLRHKIRLAFISAIQYQQKWFLCSKRRTQASQMTRDSGCQCVCDFVSVCLLSRARPAYGWLNTHLHFSFPQQRQLHCYSLGKSTDSTHWQTSPPCQGGESVGHWFHSVSLHCKSTPL